MWVFKEDLDGWEKVVPGDRLYLLTENVEKWEVDAEGQCHENVTWFVDFSKMEDGVVASHRYVTREEMTADEAQAWAERVAS